MVAERAPWLTADEYLALERDAEFKSEYWDGRMYSVAAGTEPHALIAASIASELGVQLRGSGRRTYGSDLKVQVSEDGPFTYPDVSVVRGQPRVRDEHRDVILNPVLIVEVLSPSTEAYDRGRKSQNYREMESVWEILLAAQDRPHLELYTRQPDGSWCLTEASGLDSSISLSSVPCTLRLADVYENVEFLPAEPNR